MSLIQLLRCNLQQLFAATGCWKEASNVITAQTMEIPKHALHSVSTISVVTENNTSDQKNVTMVIMLMGTTALLLANWNRMPSAAIMYVMSNLNRLLPAPKIAG